MFMVIICHSYVIAHNQHQLKKMYLQCHHAVQEHFPICELKFSCDFFTVSFCLFEIVLARVDEFVMLLLIPKIFVLVYGACRQQVPWFDASNILTLDNFCSISFLYGSWIFLIQTSNFQVIRKSMKKIVIHLWPIGFWFMKSRSLWDWIAINLQSCSPYLHVGQGKRLSVIWLSL